MVTIKSLHVEGLNGRLNYDLHFDERLNILTGRNGSGKTSILKLLWYIVSGKLEQLAEESKYSKLKIVYSDDSYSEAGYQPNYANFSDHSQFIDTYFFPTFRLIEGGFQTNKHLNDKIEISGMGTVMLILFIALMGKKSSEKRVLPKNTKEHNLIFSVSTQNIDDFLTVKYTEISAQVEKYKKVQEARISEILNNKKRDQSDALSVFNEMRVHEEQLRQPFTTLNNLIAKFYQDKGIQITQGIVLGSKDYVELAENLSSGEKQMLTFLAYSLFTKDSIIFIDEPEISLHPDWQTDLIPTLMSQNNGNQYFIATHSPFIYADYLEYDINLDELRSENSVNQAVHE